MAIKIGEKKILRSPLEPKDRNWLWLKTVAGFPVLYEYLSGKWVPFSDATAEYMEIHILSRVFGSTKYDRDNHCIEFYAADGSDAPIGVIDTSEFEVSIDADNYYTKAEVEEYVAAYVSEHEGSSADLSGYYTSSEVDTLLSGKVSVVSGKGLSTNDYTDDEKTKLAGLSNYDDTTLAGRVTTLENAGYLTTETDPTVPSWAKASSKPSYIASEVGAVPTTRKVNNKALSEDITLSASDVGAVSSTGYVATDNNFTSALKDKLDGIESGAEVNVQADWGQTTTTADDYIKNKPTIPTKVGDLTNDSGFTSNAGTITGITMNGASKGTSGVVDLGTVITAHQDISGKANASDVYTKTQTDTLLAGKQDALTFDNAPTANSNNPVKSGGINTALAGKANAADVPTKTEMADAIDDALGEAQVTVVPASSVGIITSLGSDSNSDALAASMGKKLKVALLQIYAALGNYAFPDGKPTLDFDDIVFFSVTKTIGTGLSATGGDTDVALGDSLEVTIAATDNLYVVDDNNVVVTMGGQPVVGAWNASTMKVTIGTVTGNVVINVPSMTYVDVDGSDNKLAFNLDCKNVGSNSGFWTDCIGGKQFKLTDVTISDSGAVFNGTTSKGVVMDDNTPSQYAIGTKYVDVAFDAGTIEIIATADTLPVSGVGVPLFINPRQRGIMSHFIIGSAGSYDGKLIMYFTMSASGSSGGHYSLFYNGGTNIAISAETNEFNGSLVRFNGVTQSATWYDTWLGQYNNSALSVGYRYNNKNGTIAEQFFKGAIKAIRVYNTKLTEQQMIQNYKVDKKRFNLT